MTNERSFIFLSFSCIHVYTRRRMEEKLSSYEMMATYRGRSISDQLVHYHDQQRLIELGSWMDLWAKDSLAPLPFPCSATPKHDSLTSNLSEFRGSVTLDTGDREPASKTLNTQWVETVCRRRVHFIQKIHLSHERESGGSEQASESVSAAEGASEASCLEQENE